MGAPSVRKAIQERERTFFLRVSAWVQSPHVIASIAECSRALDAGLGKGVRPHAIRRKDEAEDNVSGEEQAKGSKPDSEAMSHCLPRQFNRYFIYICYNHMT